jgi:diguanylate cyclase (GGDEF)-like protein
MHLSMIPSCNWRRLLASVSLMVWFSLLPCFGHAASPLRVERLLQPPTDLNANTLQTLVNTVEGWEETSKFAMKVERSQRTLWRIRTDAHQALPKFALLTINNSFDRDVRVFFPPNYIGEKYNLFDTQVPTAHSRFRLAIPLPHTFKAGDTIFLEVRKPRAAAFSVQIMERIAYAHEDLNLVRLHSAVVSIILTGCAVALCFFFVLGERYWLLFVAYSMSVAGYVLTRTGELLAIFGETSFDQLNWQAATILPFAISGFSVLFIHDFANFNIITPKIARALRIYGALALLFSALAFIPQVAGSEFLARIGNTLLSIGVLLTLTASVAGIKQGSRAAFYYLLAYLPLMLSTYLMMAQLRGLLDGGIWVTALFMCSNAFASVVLSFGMAAHVLDYRRQRDVAVNESQRDPLTGAFNRRAANQALQHAVKGLERGIDSLVVCFFDLDHFKRVNDQFGHTLGDHALKLLVQQAMHELRSSDVLARLGGEEFVAILPGAYLRDGLAIAERIRARVEVHGKRISEQAVNLTVSVGVVASSSKHWSAEALLEAADRALYLAKANGRNRIETVDLVRLALSSRAENAPAKV